MSTPNEIIRANIRKLCDNSVCSARLLDRCAEEGIITLDESEQIVDEKDQYSRNRAFYSCIKHIEGSRLAKLIKIMGESATKESADVLNILTGNASTESGHEQSGGSISELSASFSNVSMKENGGGNSSVQVQAQVPPPPYLSLVEQLVANKELLKASREGLLSDVQMLLSRGADMNAVGENNLTPLHFAAAYNHIDVVRFLLERGANVNSVDHDKKTPLTLHLPSRMRNLEVAALLLQHGANPNAVGGSTVGVRGKEDLLALHAAAERGDMAGTKLLVEGGADLNAVVKSSQWTSLHLALWYGHADVAGYLISKGADVMGLAGDGDTSLHLAAASGIEPRPECAKLVLESALRICGIDRAKFQTWINAVNSYGSTAILYALEAVQQKDVNYEIVKVILAYGPNLEIKDKNGLTPYALAKKNGKSKAASLIKASAKQKR